MEYEMKKAMVAKKVGMTQIFNEDGRLTPVTVLQAGPLVVTQVKTEENDGYNAEQVGFGAGQLITAVAHIHAYHYIRAFRHRIREF